MTAPDTRFARSADGLMIAHQVVGDGPGDIVFLPLFGCIDQVWDDPEYDHFLRRLAGIGRLILLDVRGIGASDPLADGTLPTPEQWTEDIRAVLDSTGSTSASIVAVGPYAILAMCLAATHPEQVRSLVLVDAYARWLQGEDHPGGSPELLEGLVGLLEQYWGTGVSTAVGVPSRAEDEAFLRWVARTERAACSPSEIAAYWRWSLGLDVRDVLPLIAADTLVVFNQPNNIARLEHSRHLVEHIPHARLQVIDRQESFLLHRAEGDRLLDHIEEFLTGSRPPARHEIALATVVFTDIVGSTERASAMGDEAWTDLLLQHDRVLQAELERHMGQKVSSRGDGWLMTFDGPERAIRCARAIIRGIREIGLEVRVGMHAGGVQRRGSDIHGLAVHIGSRIADLGDPGEILVSSTVRDLVAGSAVRFEDRGARTLRGVPDQCRIHAVVDDD